MTHHMSHGIYIMSTSIRFSDENLTLADFYAEVWVACPACARKATARADHELKLARLTCPHCGYHKEVATTLSEKMALVQPAHGYFDATLWLQAPFRDETFLAYNDRHLAYLEAYIRGTLREHRNRQGFTLLERLPKFYHLAANRKPLLRIIETLKAKG